MTSQASDQERAAARARPRRTPGPFLKWAGGKSQLLDDITKRLPVSVAGTYIEPFLGGGAVFFELVRLGRIQRATLCDRNEELVATYTAVRDDVEAVIEALGPHRNDADHFYRVRAWDPATLGPAQRAARMIFLNRVGFNGLYRVNASGIFNVPFGRHVSPKICDPDTLRAASRALAIAELRVADFGDACADAASGDVVYLDPPYVPLSRTSNFTAYGPLRFDEPEHRRLAETFGGLVDRGAYALLSNSDTPLCRELYAPFKVHVVAATRAINSKAERRGTVDELLIQGLRIGRKASRARA